MRVARKNNILAIARDFLQSAVVAFLCSISYAATAAPDLLLPADFFANQPLSKNSKIFVSADFLSVDHVNSMIVGRGNVRLSAEGYLIAADSVEYNQKTGEVVLVGSVAVRDPEGIQYTAERAQLFGAFRQGLLKSLVFETLEGFRISAADAEIRPNKSLDLKDASLTPCGNCIDNKGRKIGWRIKAAQVIRNTDDKMIYFTDGSLEFAGIPIAYLPWLGFPDPSLTDFEDIILTRVSYSEEKGVLIKYPGFVWTNPPLGLRASAEIYTRQGVLGEVNWHKGFGQAGTYSLDAWGIYQLDPTAYAGKMGETDFRGGLQGKADYNFADGWEAGGQFTTFTDRAFLPNYGKGRREGSYAPQKLFAQQLTDNSFIDVRAEYFTGLGESGEALESRQGHILPQVTGHKTLDNPYGSGEFVLDGKLIRVLREKDSISSTGGETYAHGYAGDKTHLMAQAAWRDQWALPQGLLVETYLGLRADVAQYDGASSHITAPAGGLEYSVTPIAALDVSMPLVGETENATHYLIPRLQLVSRGGPADTGITNDHALSFVFDDSNLFSFNRSSGIDRQDTGTRAALGLTYHADLESGRWYEIVFGQSYHLDGVNAAASTNAAKTGIGSGADATASHIVVGAKGQIFKELEVGAKLLLDPENAKVDRAVVAAKYVSELFDAGINYAYQSKDMGPGVAADRHEIGGNVRVPINDYWHVGGDALYDLGQDKLQYYGVEFGYDDGYAAASIYYRSLGQIGFDDDRIGFKIRLKMLADFGYDHKL